MKLVGPKPGIRFVLGRETTTAVITGCFPPERAGSLRPFAEYMAKEADPILRLQTETIYARLIDHYVYGTPLK